MPYALTSPRGNGVPLTNHTCTQYHSTATQRLYPVPLNSHVKSPLHSRQVRRDCQAKTLSSITCRLKNQYRGDTVRYMWSQEPQIHSSLRQFGVCPSLCLRAALLRDTHPTQIVSTHNPLTHCQPGSSDDRYPGTQYRYQDVPLS